jgi:hypothetical protein
MRNQNYAEVIFASKMRKQTMRQRDNTLKDKKCTKNQDFGKKRKTGGNATFGNER